MRPIDPGQNQFGEAFPDSGRGALYFNGDILTMEDELPKARAVAVRGGLIVAVGSRADCESALDGDCDECDLEGRTLLPGFIDTHLHPLVLVYFEMNVDLREARSLSELQGMLSDAAEEAGPGAWVVGVRFDEQNLDEPEIPDRHDLDEACPRNPVLLIKHDGHMVIGNTPAIDSAGVSERTVDPAGGRIDREKDGFPSGAFRESASSLLKAQMPLPSARAFEAAAESAFGKLAQCGITSVGAVMQVGEEGPAGAEGAFELPVMEYLLEHVPVNLYGILIARDVGEVDAATSTRLDSDSEGGGHHIGCVKLFADGTFGSCTAFMDAPYADAPETRGFLLAGTEEIYARMLMAHERGLQVAIHAIGDAGNRTCVRLYQRLLRERPDPGHRHRIEHASQLDQQIIDDMARLGLVVSTQPMFIHSEKHWLEKRLGKERTAWTYPIRSLIEGGVRVAGASDCPIESMDVLHAIQCCVTREGFNPDQCISVEQALRMYTIDAAYAQFEEHLKGSITPGKRADLVVLSENPCTVTPGRIKDVRVDMTVRGGKPTYVRDRPR